MEGLYVYCIRKRMDSLSTFSTDGMSDGCGVFSIPYRELEAIVSRVPLEEFGSQAIATKAREELQWIKEKAVRHEKVIEQAMENHGKILSVIPMKFGTIFLGEDRLRQTLWEDYGRFEMTLLKLDGKQEWSIKAYLSDTRRLQEAVRGNSTAIREKEQQIASLPEGEAYFIDQELQELVSMQVNEELERIRKEIFEELKIHAEEAQVCRILGNELTARLEPMILNASYLVREKKVTDFVAAADEANGRTKTRGLGIEYSGPWPPYNFVL